MKYIKYLFIGLSLLFTLQSCENNDSETITEESSNSSTTTNTEVVLTIKTSEGVLKADYSIMMFVKEFDPAKNTPSDAVETIKSDSKGMVTFDLKERDAGTYYFEAFTLKTNGTYVLESKYRTKLEIKKGGSTKTEILVKS
ncbi:hypothetical protein [Tenacibaculum piscium]|uniref:hypothetical protein n=1 Tax=Tenacibaculum piscium TaxID=1458515 RepID=UPI001F3DCC8B|nr:hypothetical protein [Tenacibaculum piscium]